MSTTQETQEQLMAKFKAAADQKKQAEAESQKKPTEQHRESNRTPISVLPVHHSDHVKEFTTFRILGLPASVREKPTDAKRVFFSDIIVNAGTHHKRVVWPQRKDARGRDDGTLDPDFILCRIYDHVMDRGEWDETINHTTKNGNKGFWTLPWKNTESYRWIKDTANGAGFTKPFMPPQNGQYVMNVISREDDWCVANKHAKLLGTRFESYVKDGEEKITTKAGISAKLYSDICSATYEYHLHWCMDVCIEKDMHKEKATDQYAKPVYKVRKPTDLEIPDEVRAKFKGELRIENNRISMMPLTEEEQQYGLYDLDKIFQPNYLMILEQFGERIAKVDEETGTQFLPELKELEKAQREGRSATVATSAPAPENVPVDATEDEDIPF